MRIRLWPDNAYVLTEEGTNKAISSIISNTINSHIKTVLVLSTDWTANVTDYQMYPEIGLTAIRADVKHYMNNYLAFPVMYKGGNEYLYNKIACAETIDGDTTRIWLYDDVPAHSVTFLFVG